MRCGREGAPLISLRLSAFVYREGEYKSFPQPFFFFTERKKGSISTHERQDDIHTSVQ